MNVRRVVTGNSADGSAVFTSDERLDPVTLELLPGFEFHSLWGTDSIVELPSDGSRPMTRGYFPPVPGSRFGFLTIPPDAGDAVPEDLDLTAGLAEFERKLPGMSEHFEPQNPGMHTTATVDYGVVLSGKVTLEVDGGAKVELQSGDTFIQNGTRHRWSNAGDHPAVLAIVCVGADQAGRGPTDKTGATLPT